MSNLKKKILKLISILLLLNPGVLNADEVELEISGAGPSYTIIKTFAEYVKKQSNETDFKFKSVTYFSMLPLRFK